MKTITKDKATKLIQKSNNKIFTAEFVKKDGQHRLMNARLNVSKGIKKDSKPRAWTPIKKGLINVFDMQLQKYRFININTLLKLNINKNKYLIK